ncbi:MAG TPA: heavy metal-binding domain-containing protein [Acidimicrobiales bacterium]|nr:heavy metal-binding domain-containing protein [Acidimicrobiales bacterium]
MSAAEQALRVLADSKPPEPAAARRPAFGCPATQLGLLEDAGWEPVGLVSGACVYHVGVIGWPRGNREMTALSEAFSAGREEALSGVRRRAGALGADGVIGLSLEVNFMTEPRHQPRFVAVGTAVRRCRRKGGSDGPLFTAAMTAAEFTMLVAAGFEPVGVVLGTCVYHVGRQEFARWAASQRRNAEMPSYTEALYEARELAMARLQEEALDLGAEGVVGVTAIESSHVWGDRAIEFSVRGNAVRRAGTAVDLDRPGLVVPLAGDRVADPGAITGTAQSDEPG